MKKILTRFLLVICIAVFLYSGYRLYGIYNEYKAGDEIYDNIKKQAVIDNDSSSKNKNSKDITTKNSSDSLKVNSSNPLHGPVNLDKIKEINKYTIAWIQIPYTNIDYPVLHPESNSSFLRTTITGEYNRAGSIFVDCNIKNPFKEGNTIIYGHNMLNGKMFSNLEDYEEKSFYKDHPIIYIQTGNKINKYHIISCYKANASADIYQYNFEVGSEDYDNYLKLILDRRYYDTDYNIEEKLPIITLSTCTNRTQEERFIVHAILSKDK